MRAFTDRSDAERLAFIGAVDAAGGAMGQYHGRYVQVCVPRVDWTPRGSHDAASVSIRQTCDGLRLIDSIARQFDLVRDDDGHFFPLGSDQPAAGLRHHGPAYCGYDAAPGYWYYVSYRPTDEPRCDHCEDTRLVDARTAEGQTVSDTCPYCVEVLIDCGRPGAPCLHDSRAAADAHTSPEQVRELLAEMYRQTSATPGPLAEVPFSLTAPVGTGGGKQDSLF